MSNIIKEYKDIIKQALEPYRINEIIDSSSEFIIYLYYSNESYIRITKDSDSTWKQIYSKEGYYDRELKSINSKEKLLDVFASLILASFKLKLIDDDNEDALNDKINKFKNYYWSEYEFDPLYASMFLYEDDGKYRELF